MAQIKLHDLYFSYQKEGKDKAVFSGMNLKLEGNLISITGPDGSGKSTFLKLLTRILQPTKGECSLLINNVENASSLGYMSEKLGLYEELSVIHNLRFFCAIKNVDPEKCEEKLNKLLTKVGLFKFKDYAVNTLSGGMKQKLALCCTLATDPKIIILDAPTVGVDPLSRREIWKIIFDYIKNQKAFCIFSTSYLEEAEQSEICIFLKEGKIISCDRPSNLLKDVTGRCFSFFCDLNYKDLLHFLIINKELKFKFLSDIFPRLNRIDLLTKKNCDIRELKNKLKKFFPASDFKLTERKPFLEDVYIALNEEKKEDLIIKTEDEANLRSKNSISYTQPEDIDIISVNDIKKSFGNFTAVHHSSFSVKRGEIFGLLGPNGAGKTTTFRMICGLLNPTSGNILINGFNLRKAKAAVREQIGYVSQKFSLYKKLTLKQNLDYFAGSYGLYGKEKENRVNYLIDDFMLRPFCAVLGEDLPFGIQRQLSMACALLHDPKILFLDEATSGADPSARRIFWKRIIELSAKGTSVIVTTHFMEEAEYCDRFLIQDKGRILCLGAPDKICVTQGKRVSVEETFISKVEEYRLKTKEATYESS
ncbi:ATP-binding cassette domain-containing protein [uncultured Succinatimonas sp.]|uniref:ATP-binding cassette domain-containing protein n=1 Tax=uncultured Succinatimonas sp. TaxID=1262973 RepID=UPI0025F347BE|nr:ATP-binding cassette domain-containing protein [uncultured Succinatimonas sp.]